MTTLSLFELNSLVRGVLQQTLDDEYWVEAEITDAHLASNGHFYFEFIQKDADGDNLIARARGRIWARSYNMLAPLFERATGERLRSGLKVRAQVTVDFHELYGYALNVIDLDPTFTMGDLLRRRHEILKQLEDDGILHDNQELPLPLLMKRIAVVSSAGAAGYGDFCNQLAHNDYGLHFELQLFAAVMQGANVEESVMAALSAIAAEAEQWDCIVIIRGGGATSDLADFDSYTLAAAVAQMPLPVIVGIGHERDETVLDFVAHTRVKTPTAAAAFLIDHGAQQLATLDDLQDRITQSAKAKIEHAKLKVVNIAMQMATAPRQRMLAEAHRIDLMNSRITQAAKYRIDNAKMKMQNMSPRFAQGTRLILEKAKLKLDSFDARLAVLDPQRLLQRGYSLTFTADGRLIKDADDIADNDIITTRLANGTVQSQVIWKKKK